MSIIRERTPQLWTIGPGRFYDRLGLVLLFAGLAGLGCVFVWPPVRSYFKWGLSLCSLVVAGVGLEMTCAQERLVIDARTKTLFLRRPFWQHVPYAFNQIERLETKALKSFWGVEELVCSIVFKSGKKIWVTDGEPEAVTRAAHELARFISTPLVPMG